MFWFTSLPTQWTLVYKSAWKMLCFNVHSQICRRAVLEGLADSTGVKIILSCPKKLIQVLKVLQLILKRKDSLCISIDILFQRDCSFMLWSDCMIYILLRFLVLSFMIFQALSRTTRLPTKWAEMCESPRKVFWFDMIPNISFPLVFESKTYSTRPALIFPFPDKLIQIFKSLRKTCKLQAK